MLLLFWLKVKGSLIHLKFLHLRMLLMSLICRLPQSCPWNRWDWERSGERDWCGERERSGEWERDAVKWCPAIRILHRVFLRLGLLPVVSGMGSSGSEIVSGILTILWWAVKGSFAAVGRSGTSGTFAGAGTSGALSCLLLSIQKEATCSSKQYKQS